MQFKIQYTPNSYQSIIDIKKIITEQKCGQKIYIYGKIAPYIPYVIGEVAQIVTLWQIPLGQEIYHNLQQKSEILVQDILNLIKFIDKKIYLKNYNPDAIIAEKHHLQRLLMSIYLQNRENDINIIFDKNDLGQYQNQNIILIIYNELLPQIVPQQYCIIDNASYKKDNQLKIEYKEKRNILNNQEEILRLNIEKIYPTKEIIGQSNWDLAQIYIDKIDFLIKKEYQLNSQDPEEELLKCRGIRNIWIDFLCNYQQDIAQLMDKYQNHPIYSQQNNWRLNLQQTISQIAYNKTYWIEIMQKIGDFSTIDDDLIINNKYIISLSTNNTVSKLRRVHLLISTLKIDQNLIPQVYVLPKSKIINVRKDGKLEEMILSNFN